MGLRQPSAATPSLAQAASRPIAMGTATTGAGGKAEPSPQRQKDVAQAGRIRRGDINRDPGRRAGLHAADDSLGDVLGRDDLHDAVDEERWNKAGEPGQPAQQRAAAVGRRREHQRRPEDGPIEVGAAERRLGLALGFGKRVSAPSRPAAEM